MSHQSDNNKRIAKNTLLLYFRMLFMMAVSLFTSRVVLNTLGVEDFGIYNVVGGVVGMFVFINNSMSSATQRYITFALGKGDKNRLQTVFKLSSGRWAFRQVDFRVKPMRDIDMIVVHCSGSRCDHRYTMTMRDII